MDRPTKFFYRVQHDGSYTHYESTYGFESRGHYLMAESHWLNKQRLESHLTWTARPLEPTPFISVFNNLEEAKRRVRHHCDRGDTGVLLAKIDASSLRRTSLQIHFLETLIHLPVWQNEDGVTFISTKDARWHLAVNVGISQDSEWFALDCIPHRMICAIHRSG